jgi:hypothetical protein
MKKKSLNLQNVNKIGIKNKHLNYKTQEGMKYQ